MNYVDPAPYGYTVFCDDVRLEAGNKQSFMGIYRGVLLSTDPYPLTLPKLCLVAHYFEPMTLEAADLKVRVYMPGQEDADDPAAEIPISPSQLGGQPLLPDVPADRQGRQLVVPIFFAPVVVEREGYVRVQVVRGEEIHRCGALLIRGGGAQDEPATQHT